MTQETLRNVCIVDTPLLKEGGRRGNPEGFLLCAGSAALRRELHGGSP